MQMNKSTRQIMMISIGAALLAFNAGCQLQQRRVDVKQPSGADQSLENRFGLTADAQDPTERDKELGYGMWKAKPEPEGTAAPSDPSRRGSNWGTVDN